MNKFIELIKSSKLAGVVIVALVVGVMLVVMSDFKVEKSESAPTEKEQDFDFEKYESELEKKLANRLNALQGVSLCDVTLILESSFNAEYAKDESGDILICENDGVKAPVIKVTYPPSVKGVSVVCKGGGNAQTQMQISEMLSALLGVPKNKIWVGEKE